MRRGTALFLLAKDLRPGQSSDMGFRRDLQQGRADLGFPQALVSAMYTSPALKGTP